MVNHYSTGRSPTELISVMVENRPVSYLRVNQSPLSKPLPLQPLAESREQGCSVLLEGRDISPHSHALTGALRTSYLSEGTGVSCVHSTHKVQGPATHASTWRSPASPHPSPLSSPLLLPKERPRAVLCSEGYPPSTSRIRQLANQDPFISQPLPSAQLWATGPWKHHHHHYYC